jgi:hypothetical protein
MFPLGSCKTKDIRNNPQNQLNFISTQQKEKFIYYFLEHVSMLRKKIQN